MKTNIVAMAVIVFFATLASAGFYLAPQISVLLNSNKPPMACTEEAKLCADGSAVGRTGPNCEFAECPAMLLGFSKASLITVGEKLKFNDGLIVALVEINDSRCKPGVVCVWAGELSVKLSVQGGNTGVESQNINLGALSQKEITINNYRFVLNDTTEALANITVSKTSVTSATPCYVGGCSGEICSDKKDMISPCIYNSTFACYKSASCARQDNGKCGWTQTPQLTACMNNDNDGSEYCAMPCTGMAPDPDFNLACIAQKTNAQCDALKSDKFPYKCDWRRRDYVCPLLP